MIQLDFIEPLSCVTPPGAHTKAALRMNTKRELTGRFTQLFKGDERKRSV